MAWYAHGDGATGGHLDRNDILANADCRGGVFAVFAKIPPPIVPHHTRLFSPHCAFLPALPSASRIPCQPRLPPINVDPTVFVATWRAASRFRNRVALPKHRIAIKTVGFRVWFARIMGDGRGNLRVAKTPPLQSALQGG